MAESAGSAQSFGGAPQLEEHRFEFRGTGGEYFRIWIVNICLTILTLGIYSAWAKVRTQRYFASSTILAGASFAYLAEPLAILRGRLLVLGFLVFSTIASAFVPLLEPVLAVALVLLVPWAIVRSLAFRAHNTSWRNLRFGFDAPYQLALNAWIGLPILSLFTLGLLYPYAAYLQARMLVDHARFGATRFEMASASGAFYRVFAVIGMLVILVLIFIMATFFYAEAGGLAVLGLAAFPLYFYLAAYYSASTTNLTYHEARLGDHRVTSRVPAAGLAVIYATNALAILASLGLLIPWTQVRLARFRLAHMSVLAAGDLEAFVAGQEAEVDSLGAELSEALDLDLGL